MSPRPWKGKDLDVDELRHNYRSSMFAFFLLIGVSIVYQVFVHIVPWGSLAFAAMWAGFAIRDWRRWQRKLEQIKWVVKPPSWVWDGKHWVPAPKVSLVKKEKDDQASDPQDRK